MRCYLLSSMALLAGAAPSAQVPDGHFAISTFADSTRRPGGVFLVAPRLPRKPVPVTGLGSDLTGRGAGNRIGANALAIRRSDGAVLVGETGMPGTAIDLHVITLQGSAVRNDVKLRIGTVQARAVFGGGITQIAMLPNGDALLGLAGVPNAPLVVVSPRRRTVTAVKLSPRPPGECNAAAVDAAGTTAFFAMRPFPSPLSRIYSVPIPAGGRPTLIGTTFGVSALAIDRKGHVIHDVAGFIFSLDPRTGMSFPIGVTGARPNGLDLERVTDNIVYVLNGFGSEGPAVKWMTRRGRSTTLTAALTGVPSGVAVNHDPWTFGSGTPGNARYRWQVEPAVGGLPRLGNSAFTLVVRASGGSPGGSLFASTAPAEFVFLGATVLLSPGGLRPVGRVPASGTVPLPIPNDPVLAGGTVYLQSLHLDAGAPRGIAATPGLRLTVLR